jgi:hypothetical protein
MLGAGIAETVAGNVSFGWSSGLVGALVSAWPALCFAGSVEMLLALIRTARRAAEIEARPDDGPMPSVHRVFAEDIAARTVPSIQAIKTAMGCGQDRATQVQAYLSLLASN